MDNSSSFHKIVKTLFHPMGIDVTDDFEKEVYEVKVGETAALRLFCDDTGCMNIVSLVGPLPNQAPESMLIELLALNNCQPVLPNLNVGLIELTNMLELRMRQRLSVLCDNTSYIEEMFASMLRAVQEVEHILNKKNEAC